ncbi:MAG: IS5 family transposase, partial [Granulosicoccus sp.]
MAQMGFFELSDRYASLDAKKDPLVEIDDVVPWEE